VGVSRECRDCPNFLEYPLLSQERVKLRSSNLAGVFRVSMRTKTVKNLGEKGAWAYPWTSHFEYPLLSQECIKLRTSNLACIFTGPIEQMPLKYLGEKAA